MDRGENRLGLRRFHQSESITFLWLGRSGVDLLAELLAFLLCLQFLRLLFEQVQYNLAGEDLTRLRLDQFPGLPLL